MEEWKSIVRSFKDRAEISYKTEELAIRIRQDLKRFKIKEKGKFRQRMGPEFENWILSLSEDFSQEAVSEFISDDDFWTATLKITLGV